MFAQPASHSLQHDRALSRVHIIEKHGRGEWFPDRPNVIGHSFPVDERILAEFLQEYIRRSKAGGRDGWCSRPHHGRFAAAKEIVPLRPGMESSEHVLSEHLLRAGDGAAILKRIPLDRAGCRQFGVTEARCKARKPLFENIDQAILLALLRRFIRGAGRIVPFLEGRADGRDGMLVGPAKRLVVDT